MQFNSLFEGKMSLNDYKYWCLGKRATPRWSLMNLISNICINLLVNHRDYYLSLNIFNYFLFSFINNIYILMIFIF